MVREKKAIGYETPQRLPGARATSFLNVEYEVLYDTHLVRLVGIRLIPDSGAAVARIGGAQTLARFRINADSVDQTDVAATFGCEAAGL